MRSQDVEYKFRRLDALFKKVSGIPKPKDDSKSKFGKNFKIDNITIDGNQGDVNWEDFIKIDNGNMGGRGDDGSDDQGEEEIINREDPSGEEL